MKKILLLICSIFFQSALAQEPFTDQDNIQSWAEKAIHTLKYLEIIQGNKDGSFQPNQSINRAEFSKIIILATKTPLQYSNTSKFNDVDNNDWFHPYIETARRKGWIEGYEDNTFKPGNTINRAEIAKIVSEAFNLPQTNNRGPWYQKYIQSLSDQEMLPYNTTAQDFRPQELPSRSEITEMIYRIMKKLNFFDENHIPFLLEKEPDSTGFSTEDTSTNPSSDELTPFVSEQERGAGILSITKEGPSGKKIEVRKNQSNIKLLTLQIKAKDNSVKISGLQVRRIGRGAMKNFEKISIQYKGEEIASTYNPKEDIVPLKFNQPITISSNKTETFTFLTDMSSDIESEISARFVLYLPEWIEANTQIKNGFFPFGGNTLYKE